MSPWFTNFHGHQAGTYVLTTKGSDADEDTERIFKSQEWLVYIGPHVYYIFYESPRDRFDSNDGTEIRNHFINSIRFIE